jgi:hypothetical protein
MKVGDNWKRSAKGELMENLAAKPLQDRGTFNDYRKQIINVTPM